ncbi:trans-1,2-dihydrobenzene-1,2-diol dehydrogenase-like isoform X2 [Heptranchias perlo]|uniref:trans-1,2-dihydrobenzene-1,2-diol dehydrogenase-like isoform X2 n=1 Tax=Heptranchias perlo TaxID=212740 RepID=UPI003559FBFE
MATRWGICSAGKICHDFMVALKTLPAADHQAVAVASRDSSRARDFAKRHEIPKSYGSYEELANDPNIDIVYVGTINPQHLRVALLMLQAGKNVLCEKPMAMNLREVQQLICAARDSNRFLMEGLWTRFFPVSNAIRCLLSQNNLGEVKMVKAEFGTCMMGTPRVVEKDLGGGVLLDIGCYCLQFVCMVFNGEKPESIHATGFLTEKDSRVYVVPHKSGGEWESQGVSTASSVSTPQLHQQYRPALRSRGSAAVSPERTEGIFPATTGRE